MDDQGASGPQSLKKDRSHAQDERPASEAPRADVSAASQNGEHSGLSNGVPTTNGDFGTANGGHAHVPATLVGSEDPPPLDQSWREGISNKSLGVMVDRLAQQAYIDLNSTLAKMAELPADNAPQTNGLGAQGQLDPSANSQEKKRLLMDFAHDQRDRFTKALVLSDWTQNGDEMAKFVDIKVWQDRQRGCVMNAKDSLGVLKRSLAAFKVPAPNIEGAMELLSTGKAAAASSLGYIPPKRLTAKQLLKALRKMNVTLSTRLNLHGELPAHMNDFTVANGRATFSVAGEFEVDLAIADEELTSPFYFIDIRFLFTPSFNILNERIRKHLEDGANVLLAKKSLQGCYDFLHNFVLTHKITVLRSQAQELLRGKWFDCIKVEGLRRSLVVQYWAGMPGPKNWIEIGVSSGKVRNGRGTSGKATPRLAVRWFRKGQEVKDEVLDFDWNHLNMEACLMTVIGKHCFGKVRAATDGLSALCGENTVLEMDMPASDAVAPEDCALQLRLPNLRKPLSVRLEPVTGQFSLSPPSNATFDAERRLNNDPKVDPPRLLAALACALVQERVHKQAEVLGWQGTRNISSLREKFGAGALQHSVFQMPGWGQQWVLGVSFGLHGEKWWVVQLQPPQAEQPTAPRVSITVRELAIEETLGGKQSDVSTNLLLRIERLAVAEVSYTVLSQQLRSLRIPHSFEKPRPREDTGMHQQQQRSGAVYLQFAALMRDVRDKAWKPWALDSVRLSHHGIEPTGAVAELTAEQTPVRHDLRLTLDAGKMKHLKRHLTKTRDQDVALNDTGGLAVRLRTPFGEPFAEQIRSRLRNVERLDRYVAVLLKLGYTCTHVSLSQLSFTYGSTPELSAQLSFASDGGLPIRLKLAPAHSNPHQRIRVMLEQSLNNGRDDAFQLFVHVLLLSLPVMETFDRLEVEHMAKRTAVVRVRGVTWYHITYKAPLTPVTMCIRARSKKEGNKTVARWHIALPEANGKAADQGLPEAFAGALKAIWNEKGDGWFGVGGGIIANSKGIRPAIERVNEFVRSYEAPVEQASKTEEPAPAVAESNGVKKPPPVPAATPPHQVPKKAGAPPTRPTRPLPTKKEPDVIMLDD